MAWIKIFDRSCQSFAILNLNNLTFLSYRDLDKSNPDNKEKFLRGTDFLVEIGLSGCNVGKTLWLSKDDFIFLTKTENFIL